MSNDYFNYTTPLVRYTRARAEQVGANLEAIAAGFDKLPTTAEFKDGNYNVATDNSVSDNTYVIATPKGISGYTDGLRVSFFAARANTAAAVTANVDGKGAIPVKRWDGSDLEAADITAGASVELRYDAGNNRFLLHSANAGVINTAKDWASKTGGTVDGTEYSAKHHAQQAASSANAAATSATNAATSATNAATSATNAASSASAAATSATNAAASETKARKWAEEAENVEVEPGAYSAKHWAAKALSNATGITKPATATGDNLVAFDGGPDAAKDSGIPMAQVARKDQGATFSGAVTGIATGGAIIASNGSGTAQTSMMLTREGAAVDEKRWEILHDTTGDLVLRAPNDAYSASTQVLALHRGAGYASDGVTVGNPTSGPMGAGTLNAEALYINGVEVTPGGAFGGALLHVRDEKPSGTHGGTTSGGGYVTRDLNTVVTNEITGASLASNRVTLPAGTYFIMASAPAYVNTAHKLYLYNVSTATVVITGTAEHIDSQSYATTRSFVCGRFTVAATQDFELRHYCNQTVTTTGLGEATSMGQNEVYAEAMIWKVS